MKKGIQEKIIDLSRHFTKVMNFYGNSQKNKNRDLQTRRDIENRREIENAPQRRAENELSVSGRMKVLGKHMRAPNKGNFEVTKGM